MKFLKIISFISIFVVLSAGAAFAQKETPKLPAGFQGETIGQIDAAGSKLIQLAEAMPVETLAWRPGEGVRSSSEVLMHVAQANYFILGIAGVKPPADLPKEMEKITSKDEVVAHLKRSFEYSKAAIAKMSDEDLNKPVKLFGNDATVRAVLLLMSVHSHEHLGQLIAYARMNKIAPPWSAGSGDGE